MIYYTSDLQKVEFTPNREPIAYGKQGSVYGYGENKCVKIYREDVQKYESEIFALFKELSLGGIVNYMICYTRILICKKLLAILYKSI